MATFDKVEGDVSVIKLEGLSNSRKCHLALEGNNLYLVVEGVRDASTVVWTGAESGTWDVAHTENFAMASDATKANFVNGDKVVFNDDGAIKNVVLSSDIEADSVIFDNTAAYNLSGEGAITGNTVLVKRFFRSAKILSPSS